jgi:signal transduction histidine kinase
MDVVVWLRSLGLGKYKAALKNGRAELDGGRREGLGRSASTSAETAQSAVKRRNFGGGVSAAVYKNKPMERPNSIYATGSSIRIGSARALSVATPVGLVLIYVLLDWATFFHSYKGSVITPWEPGIGILYAIIVANGALFGLPLLVGVVCAELLVRPTIFGVPTLLNGAVAAGAYTAAAMMARYYFAVDVRLTRLRDIVILILTGLVGALIFAIFAPLAQIVVGRFDIDDLLPSILTEFIGDATGIAIVSPLVLRFWRSRLTLEHIRSVLPEAAILAALVGACLLLILETSLQYGSNFFYLLFLPVIIAALRRGIDGACVSLLVTQIGLVFLLQSNKFDALIFTEFQAKMLILTATALSVGAVVSEREQAQRAFQETEERLRRKEADALRAGRFYLVSAMASALAHEINQPITAARAFARSTQEILRGTTPDLPRADRNLTTLVSQIDVAGNIVRRIREFLQRGPIMGDVDVRGMLEDVLVLTGPEAASAQISIDLVVEDNLPRLRGDRDQLEQLILNLVRNSIDAIGGGEMRGGRIRVAAQRSNGTSDLAIIVWDNGPGIATDVAGHLFEPLTTSKPGGLGLGLCICWSIVAAHGGRISLEATGAGGTEFRVTLPSNSAEPA